MLKRNMALFYLSVGHRVFCGRGVQNKRTKKAWHSPQPPNTTSFQKIPYSLAFRIVKNKSSRKKKGIISQTWWKNIIQVHSRHGKSQKKSKILLLLLDLIHSTFGFVPFCSENCWWRQDRIWPENTMMTHVLEKCKALTQLPKFF